MFAPPKTGLAVVAVASLLMTACAVSPSSESTEPVVETYACGQLDLTVMMDPAHPLINLQYLDKGLLLKPSDTGATGVYLAPGDPSTRLVREEGRARLTIRGQEYPECLPPGAVALPFTAQGSTPAWRARTQDDTLVLHPPYETDQTLQLPVALAHADRHGREFVAQADGVRVRLTVAGQLCQDPVTGGQFPHQVRLTVNGEGYDGGGGDPQRLFRGGGWVVDDLAGAATIDGSRLTLQFLADDRIAGRASCNRYQGQYQLSDSGALTVSGLGSTRMACAPALMQQEARFLELLGQVTRARIGQDGSLRLSTDTGATMTAFQSDHDMP